MSLADPKVDWVKGLIYIQKNVRFYPSIIFFRILLINIKWQMLVITNLKKILTAGYRWNRMIIRIWTCEEHDDKQQRRDSREMMQRILKD